MKAGVKKMKLIKFRNILLLLTQITLLACFALSIFSRGPSDDFLKKDMGSSWTVYHKQKCSNLTDDIKAYGITEAWVVTFDGDGPYLVPQLYIKQNKLWRNAFPLDHCP